MGGDNSYVDARLADQWRATIMGGMALFGMGLIAFLSSSRATTVALDSERRATKAALESNNREVESHNGKIRQWEVTQAAERVSLATKEEVRPLREDFDRRTGSAVTANKFWAALAFAVTLSVALGFGLANLVN